MRAYRTALEQKIRERRQTLEEFAEYAETYARQHRESGTLSLRHLQRMVAGRGPNGQPLGRLRPATARLLEHIFDMGIDELLGPPTEVRSDDATTRLDHVVNPTRHVWRNLSESFGWLDEYAGWRPDTTRQEVASQLMTLDIGELIGRQIRRAKVGRRLTTRALLEYYGSDISDYGIYGARCGKNEIMTSVVSASEWLNLAGGLSPHNGQLTLLDAPAIGTFAGDEVDASHAVRRLAEVSALDVRLASRPLYRLLSVQTSPGAITGTVGLAPFVEYALTMDLLESELVDAVTAGMAIRRGSLPLRDKYLPDLTSVLDISARMCAGGVQALCAIARPSDPYRGPADYALLVQERSRDVLNSAGRLALIPKGFHQPFQDLRVDAHIAATMLRKMEEELFGRADLDNTVSGRRAADPMHPARLSEPMRWLQKDSGRLRLECTGFGLNLVSGNYEFPGLIVIDDEEFWIKYGGHVEANWESAGLRLYSSLDDKLIGELISDEAWSNEGIFAFTLGVQRLREIGGARVNLPPIESRATGR